MFFAKLCNRRFPGQSEPFCPSSITRRTTQFRKGRLTPEQSQTNHGDCPTFCGLSKSWNRTLPNMQTPIQVYENAN